MNRCGECNQEASISITAKNELEKENAPVYYFCIDCYAKNKENAN